MKIGIGAAIILLIIAALYIFYTFNPEMQPLFPKCPFLLATGYECPGCGSQRAIHSLLHFNVGAALRYNAFMVLALPYIFLGIYQEYLGGKKRHPKIGKFFFGRWSAIAILLIIVAFWVGRNLI
ncbi:DUF2752 domain-containing protein [Proteiniphilum sp. UBA5384]|uniref:DUF2752 domain-containing protein n=1 Tax=Proteiniphilum sp. UBA5384 TaxID=1947279 RepID=UPI0025D7ACB1|nr:DUF2752 domain-containing protein [Proteiniphilum sp. UBA5384]